MTEPASGYVIAACERETLRLAEATLRGDTDAVIDIKGRADGLRVHALHEHLDAEANLAASELMRRAERALGLALRAGQNEGTVHTTHTIRRPGLKTVGDFMPRGKTATQVLALVDGISDVQFEDALAKARANGNLSRVQLIRLLRDTVPAAPKPRKAPIRQPLPDFANESGWRLRKAVERIERLLADRRYPENKTKVAAHLHGHLTYTVETLTKVLDQINPQGD